MVHFPGSNRDERTLPRGSAGGADPSWRGYRFASMPQSKWRRGRAALNRVNFYLRFAIEAMADARLRRAQRDPGYHVIGRR